MAQVALCYIYLFFLFKNIKKVSLCKKVDFFLVAYNIFILYYRLQRQLFFNFFMNYEFFLKKRCPRQLEGVEGTYCFPPSGLCDIGADKLESTQTRDGILQYLKGECQEKTCVLWALELVAKTFNCFHIKRSQKKI